MKRPQLVKNRDLRYSIGDALAARDIEIPFPQRDLHVDVQRPFEVRLLSPEAQQDEIGEAASKEAA